ncbi:MAG: glycoside hydrolase family 78 protein [Tannerellaceae bacterium]|nr:glycoside hydrolase family 78 protein [Tannerellaceae bacterium]
MKQLTLLLICLFTICAPIQATALQIKNPRIEMLTDPIGIDIQSPRFLWQLKANENEVYQTAYQILVATSENDLNAERNLSWNSGKISSGNSIFIPYEGTPLESRKTYYWKVKVWTNKGETPWSKTNQWRMAFTDRNDWQAKWIGLDKSQNEGDKLEGETRLAARYVRKEFTSPANIRKATLYITGLGFYECYLNGEKVGNDVFAPTATDYSKQVNYNTYDVTGMLSGGANTVGVILGNGRYFSMRREGVRHFGFPKMLMQLEIEDNNGNITTITSDDSWKLTTNGPIIANNEFDGEEFDANRILHGWNRNGYKDTNWQNASLVEEPGGKLIAQRNPNIQVMKEIKPLSITQTSRGTYMVDMGQNMVGWLNIQGKAQKNKPVRMVFAELLQPDGNLYLDNLRSARVTDIYTPAETGTFTWEPVFTYHGFRFVEISGLDQAPSLNDLTGKVIYDRMSDTGSFECSNSLLNQLYKNAYWGITGNYRSMPTDCPQRDERMGWLGDRGMGCIGESFLVEQALLYEKWIEDIRDAQQPGGSIPDVAPDFWDIRTENVTWPAAYIFAINMLYEQYGNIRPIRQHYDAMKLWVNHIMTNFMTDYIVTKDTFGDWCMPPERQELIHSEDPARKTDGAILSTTFFHHILQLMSKFATLNGYTDDRQEFDRIASLMRNSYNEKYLDKETGQYGNNTVTANLLSLRLGLTPAEYQKKVFKNILEKTKGEFNSHVSTGLIGIQHMMRGLTQYGEPELAYTIATNTTYPSWGYMIEKGATTIWELWNGDTADPAMNSANHVMLLGDLMIWYYECLAGISTDKEQVGFKKIQMKPFFPEKLDFVNASYESIYGLIRSEWIKVNGQIEWKITIPANTTAEVTLPTGLATLQGETSFTLPSGNYLLQIR